MTRGGRSPARNVELRECVSCSSTFLPYRAYQTTCSAQCRKKVGPDRFIEHELLCQRCGKTETILRSRFGGYNFKWCSACAPIIQKEKTSRSDATRRENGKAKEYTRKANLARRGLTADEYEKMLADQNGVCDICGDAPTGGKTAAARLHVDHDHQTGVNRALLCGRCNMGLGYFRDNPEFLAQAIAYLARH